MGEIKDQKNHPSYPQAFSLSEIGPGQREFSTSLLQPRIAEGNVLGRRAQLGAGAPRGLPGPCPVPVGRAGSGP